MLLPTDGRANFAQMQLAGSRAHLIGEGVSIDVFTSVSEGHMISMMSLPVDRQ